MPLISIIVPIYKVEKYLSQCLDSLICQTLKDIEIICINDGSPDNCPQILKEYSDKDKRIKTINKQNEGLSRARNDALKLVTAPYVSYVDSDDWIEPETYETAIKIIQQENPDILTFNYRLVYEDGKTSPWNSFPHNIPGISKMSFDTDIPELSFNVWNKIFKTEVIKNNNILFPDDLWYEDVVFHYKYMCNIHHIVFVNEPFYNYRIRNDSIMGQTNKGQKRTHICDRVLGMLDLYHYLQEHHLFGKFQSLFTRSFMQAVKHDVQDCADDLKSQVWTEAQKSAAIIAAEQNITEFSYFLAGKYHKIFDLNMPSFLQKIFSIRKEGKRLLISVLGLKFKKKLR